MELLNQKSRKSWKSYFSKFNARNSSLSIK
jgi:hypothetical protein